MAGTPFSINTTQNPAYIPEASESADGLMSAADKTKLDGLSGGTAPTPVRTSGAFTPHAGETVRLDPSAGGFVVNLPKMVGTSASPPPGGQIIFKFVKNSVNPVTLTAAGGDTIDLQPTFVMNLGFMSVTLEADGVNNWMVI